MLNIFIYVRWDNHRGAENICKQLGYAGGTHYTAGGGTGPINAGNRLCSGGEKTVFDCPLQGGRTDTTRCTHNHDQGVHCTKEGETKTNYQAQSLNFASPNLNGRTFSNNLIHGKSLAPEHCYFENMP